MDTVGVISDMNDVVNEVVEKTIASVNSVNEVSTDEGSTLSNELVKGSDTYYCYELQENEDRLFTVKDVKNIVDGCLRMAAMKEGKLKKAKELLR